MPSPRTLKDLPPCWIRSAFGTGRTVGLIDTALAIVDDATRSLGDDLSAEDQAKRYWVVSCTKGNLQTEAKVFSVPNKMELKIATFDDYDAAEQQYADWSDADAKKTVKRGLDGLGKIGKDE